MDGRHFDNLAAIFARTQSRRRAIWLLGAAAGALAAWGEAPAAAKRRKCGGKRQRCPDGRRCKIDNNCVSGTCANGRCVACTPTLLCGSDEHGACQCDKAVPANEPTCVSSMPLGLTVDDCAKCPAGTEACVSVNGLLYNCSKRCGSRA